MAGKWVGAVFKCQGKFTPMERLVLAALGNFTRKELGYAWPSVMSIARVCGMARRSVQYVLETLSENGIVAIEPTDGGAKKCTHKFTINLERLKALTSNDVITRRQRKKPKAMDEDPDGSRS